MPSDDGNALATGYGDELALRDGYSDRGPIDPGVDESLLDFIARKKAGLPDAVR